MFTALLDTCVLWPSLQRDFLLSLAIEGVYRPVWSSAILDELEYQEAKKLVSRGIDRVDADGRAARLVETMRTAFDDAEVIGWEPLAGLYGLPDPNDEHVVAAAVVANAGVLVTNNFKDFPTTKVPAAIEVMPPYQFAHDAVSLAPARAVAAVHRIADRSGSGGRGTRSVEDICGRLQNVYKMDAAVRAMRAEGL